MKRSYIFSILLVFVVLFSVVGFFIFKNKKIKITESSKQITAKQETNQMPQIDYKYVADSLIKDKISKKVDKENFEHDYGVMQKVISGNDTLLCNDLVQYSKDDCYYDLATINKNNEICVKIQDQSLATSCQDMIMKKNSLAVQMKSGQPQYKADYKIMELAVMEQNFVYCEYLSLYSKDNCYYDIATVNRNFNECDRIVNMDLKNKCHELSVEYQAIQESDMGKCLSIKDGDFQKQCIFEVFNKMENVDQCEAYPDKSLACRDIVYKKLAYKKNDVNICDKISDEAMKSDCVLISGGKKLDDSDHDGISDIDEMGFGTDPQKADTDGDGYSDGEEIKAGHNPLGI